jgi:hypothetical protein
MTEIKERIHEWKRTPEARFTILDRESGVGRLDGRNSYLSSRVVENGACEAGPSGLAGILDQLPFLSFQLLQLDWVFLTTGSFDVT